MKRIKSIFYFVGSVLPIILFSCSNRKSQSNSDNQTATASKLSFYDFAIPSLVGDSSINMASFKGKKVLIVNVASKCGYTPQYKDLETLNKQMGDKLVIIGCPSNQFLGQEPGTATEIAEFCSLTYGVSFRMTQKMDVIGKNQHPLYQWLTQKSQNNVSDNTVSWNFNKFLIDENGNLIKHFGSKVNPMSAEIKDLL